MDLRPLGRGPHHILCGYVWLKWCKQGSHWVTVSGYSKLSTTKDGLQARCKLCDNANSKKYHEKHREKRNAEHKKWREENRELVLAYDKKYREENPEREKARQKKYHEENPEKKRQRNAKRRASKKGATVGVVDFAFILERDGMVCHICSRRVEDNSQLHFDHVIPLSRGGEHSNDNIKVSHAVCNMSKGTKLIEEIRV